MLCLNLYLFGLRICYAKLFFFRLDPWIWDDQLLLTLSSTFVKNFVMSYWTSNIFYLDLDLLIVQMDIHIIGTEIYLEKVYTWSLCSHEKNDLSPIFDVWQSVNSWHMISAYRISLDCAIKSELSIVMNWWFFDILGC